MSERKPIEARKAAGWAMYSAYGWIFTDSVWSRRSEVVAYANNDAAPGWNWAQYRKRGFYIAKVDIVPRRPNPPSEGETR